MAEHCTCSGRICRTKEEKAEGKCDTCFKPWLTLTEIKALIHKPISKGYQKRPYTKMTIEERRDRRIAKYKDSSKKKVRENCDHIMWAQIGDGSQSRTAPFCHFIKEDGYCTDCKKFVLQETIDKYKELGITSIHKE